jgi:hypothetical protein
MRINEIPVVAFHDRPPRRMLPTAERQLAKGDKALIGHTGFRRYLKTISDEHFGSMPTRSRRRKSSTAGVMRLAAWASYCGGEPVTAKILPLKAA